MPTWTNEQLLAINEEGKNIIVSAGAGSGKTAVLTNRVIRKIKSGVKINELLILTFTNLAAKEMKERIKKNLKKEGLMEEYNSIDSAYITTFDSYSLSMLKKYHYLLNVSPNVDILEDSILTLKEKEILDDIFEKLYASNDSKFNKLINDFCMKDDKELKNLILGLSSKLDLISDKKLYLDTYINNYYNEERYNFLLDSFMDILRNKIELIKKLCNEISYYCEKEQYESLIDFFNSLFNSETYEDIRRNTSSNAVSIRGLDEEAKKIKDKINKCYNEIKEICEYNSLEEAKEEIIETKDYIECIIDILKELNERIDEYKFKNDLYTFNDIEKLVIKLIKENTEVRNEIKNSYKEIMIDEYQDTNNLQEEFISLIENNNVYMVGDLKQSIYRFRNANPSIFKNKYDKYKNNDGGMKIDLNKNFRSREETLTNINLIFNLVMDNVIGGTNYLENQLQFGNLSYSENILKSQNSNFEIYNYDFKKDLKFKKEEYEAFIIAKDIIDKISSNYKVYDKDENVIRNAEYKDFVILMDRSTNYDTYNKVFNYFKIPLEIYKDEKINDDEIFILIKNIISLLINIKNNNYDNSFKHAYVSLIRSFLFEYDDEKIFDLIKEDTYKNDEVFITLKDISNQTDYLPVSDIIELIINRLDIINKLPRVGDIDNKLTAIEYIINFSKTIKNNNIEYFNEYLDNLLDEGLKIEVQSKMEDSNSVKLMTIYKSKGLEYNICYYSGLYSEFVFSDVQERIIYDEIYGIYIPVFKEGIKDTIVKRLIKDNYIKEVVSEKLRLLYVALTRAKEKMILLCDLNLDEERNNNYDNGIVKNEIRLSYKSFQDILSSITFSLKEYTTNIDIEDYNLTKDYEIETGKEIKLPSNNEVIEVDELEDISVLLNKEKASKDVKLITVDESKLMEEGTKIHKIFEYEDFNNPVDNRVKDFLSVYNYDPKSTVYKELEFSYEKDNKIINGIIDLMIEYSDHIDIIDYKLSNIEDETYNKQLKEYKDYISSIKDKEVNIYLYSINNKTIVKLD